MSWFVMMLLLESALAVRLPEVPAEPGVYLLRGAAAWVELLPAAIAEARTRGLKTFIDTGGYTRFFVDIVFEGEQAARRTTDRSPRFFCRGPLSATDFLIVRLTPQKGRRVSQTSPGSASVANKPGFPGDDVFRLNTVTHDDGSFSATPEDSLPPGEYLLVTGDLASGCDFGVD